MVIKKISNAVKCPYNGQILFIVVGLGMAATTLIKLLTPVDFSSDWFWFIAGLGLTVEGVIMFGRQRTFARKYKVIERE